jgi:hypothetical protein
LQEVTQSSGVEVKYRHAVASGQLGLDAVCCERDPTLLRYGTDLFATQLDFARALPYPTLVNEGLLPQLESQQLKHLKIVVFSSRKVRVNHSLHFLWTEESTAFDRFF